MSVDTTKASGRCTPPWRRGQALLNDVSSSLARGGRRAWRRLCRDAPQGNSGGHAASIPVTTTSSERSRRSSSDASAEARAAGVDGGLHRPGIGFGKSVRHNLQLLAALARARRHRGPGARRHEPQGFHRSSRCRRVARRAGRGRPAALGPMTALEGSLASAVWAMACGAAMVRVHDVAATVQAARSVRRGTRHERALGGRDRPEELLLDHQGPSGGQRSARAAMRPTTARFAGTRSCCGCGPGLHEGGVAARLDAQPPCLRRAPPRMVAVSRCRPPPTPATCSPSCIPPCMAGCATVSACCFTKKSSATALWAWWPATCSGARSFPDGPRAITAMEQLLRRQMGTVGRMIVSVSKRSRRLGESYLSRLSGAMKSAGEVATTRRRRSRTLRARADSGRRSRRPASRRMSSAREDKMGSPRRTSQEPRRSRGNRDRRRAARPGRGSRPSRRPGATARPAPA